MDKVYQSRYPSTINIGEHFNLYENNLLPQQKELHQRMNGHKMHNNLKELKNLMNYTGSMTEFKELDESISLDDIQHPDDIIPQSFSRISTNFSTRMFVDIPKRALRLKYIASLLQFQSTHHFTYRQRTMRSNKYKPLSIPGTTVADLQPFHEIIITVRISEPFKYRLGTQYTSKPRLCQEFLLLGTQYLTELRDKIWCQCRYGPLFDISNTYPNDLPKVIDQQSQNNNHINENSDLFNQSIKIDNYDDTDNFEENDNDNYGAESNNDNEGFFFIHDTFYNDMRDTLLDYSEEIRKWLKNNQKSITESTDEFKTNEMENVQFSDLSIKLGYPYVYQHYGNCEHLITFSDVRLLAPTDCLERKHYPILQTMSSTKPVFCNICGQSQAKFIVRECNAHIHDPAFLCNICFESYHYVDGKKQGEFKAYRYYGNTSSFQNEHK